MSQFSAKKEKRKKRSKHGLMTYSSKGSKIIETVDKSRWKKVIVIYIYIIIGKVEKKSN